jgi:hypothetical protein
VDFGKIASILSQINTDALDLEDVGYLPSDFWKDLEDGLALADLVEGGWAEPTDMGKSQLEFAWRMLCSIRELDPEVMYDSVEHFFESQATPE